MSEEEEKYWFKLARKVEIGPKRARLSRSEMFEKMELKFGSRVSIDPFSNVCLAVADLCDLRDAVLPHSPRLLSLLRKLQGQDARDQEDVKTFR